MPEEGELHERVRAALASWSIPHRVLELDPRDLERVPGLRFVDGLTLPR